MSGDHQAFFIALLGRNEPQSHADRIEAEMSRGQAAAIQGVIVIVASVLIYCTVAFRGGLEVEMLDLLSGNASPIATAALIGLGGGTLLWVAGCVTYLRAAMEAEGPDGL